MTTSRIAKIVPPLNPRPEKIEFAHFKSFFFMVRVLIGTLSTTLTVDLSG